MSAAQKQWERYRDQFPGRRRQLRKRDFLEGFEKGRGYQQGIERFTKDAQDLVTALDNMSPGAREVFRVTYAAEIKTVIDYLEAKP